MIARPFAWTPPADALVMRTRITAEFDRLKSIVGNYHHHPHFDNPKRFAAIIAPMPGWAEFAAKRASTSANGPSIIDPGRWPLLTKDQEFHLFRRLNFHRHQVSGWLPASAAAISSMSDLRELQTSVQPDLESIKEVNEILIRCNLGLVTNAAGKYPSETWDELSSIGQLTIVRCVQTFNPFRGSRLSTYVTTSIHKNFHGHFRSKKERESATTSLPDNLIVPPRDRPADSTTGAIADWMLDQLTDRQRMVISYRFGLNGCPRSLQEIAALLGMTKQGVHDSERRALETMKRLAEQVELP